MKTEIKWGIIVGVLTFLWFVLEKVSGFHAEFIEYHKSVGYFFLIPLTLVYAFGLLDKRNNDLGGSMTWGQGVKTAFTIAAISVPLVVLAAYIQIAFMSPDFQDNLADYLLTTGTSEDQANAIMSTPRYLMTSVIHALFGGVIGSILAYFIKR